MLYARNILMFVVLVVIAALAGREPEDVLG